MGKCTNCGKEYTESEILGICGVSSLSQLDPQDYITCTECGSEEYVREILMGCNPDIPCDSECDSYETCRFRK
jgi:DNA-directed RNA polymerase subunit RPC12/RpoP